ncbi:16S rRNA (uracil(1498)-N(3))-methyltransferase [Algiphilus sp. W345]|uniref:Ribosomal RNA small subunit methyltransferase E n=1 Tax=Banduia mediterranea TaxID=3075609 RepID=A0ABU2WJK5_9GAMM|nr:16S rRNA (uracil(1498)-N(3))-methyltransferase [Algiphilus sp. W345]MDT0498037.1 16S rRNA (uracil(1498)-N(3))-methyltransferase [Algiphilus sp. W345]
MTRFFADIPLASGVRVDLPAPAFRHAVQVLRLREADPLTLFNGDGQDYLARLGKVTKRAAQAEILESIPRSNESRLSLTLVQGVSKGERMDWAIQKAVELGVARIAPVITERCNVKLDAERWDRKLDHWRGVVISACEQSGRARLPELDGVMPLRDWLSRPRRPLALVLDPTAERTLDSFVGEPPSAELLIGPEGGLSDKEVALAAQAGFDRLKLGPRVLRTETAALTAIAVLQARFGDL